MVVSHRAKNGLIHRKMGVDCPLVFTPIVETLLQNRPRQMNNWSSKYFAKLSVDIAFGLVFCNISSLGQCYARRILDSDKNLNPDNI